jgi:formylglycine-generating enzyme required for sulfatase activity
MLKMIPLLLFTGTLCIGVWAADAPAPVAAPLPATKVNAIDGAAMVLIPAGAFLMGTSEAELAAWLKAQPGDTRELYTDELPQHSVSLDAYYMYKTDVTVAQYRIFCRATGRKMPDPPDWGWQDTHPMVNVTWNDAKAYADWAGAALPTEAQWEKAARGTDGRIFPWGNDWDAGKCSNSVGTHGSWKTSPVGNFPAGASPYGCLDMAGNVSQWCADRYDAGYYATSPARNPTGPETGPFRVLRGGSWCYGDLEIFRAALRVGDDPLYRGDYMGFQCVVRSPGP